MSKKYFIIGGVIAAIGGLAWYANNQYKLSWKLVYSVIGYKIISISKEGAKVDLKVNIENKGELQIKLKRLKLKVFADDKFMATAFTDIPVYIEPKKSVETTIQILFPKSLLKNIAAIILDTASASSDLKNMNLKVDGSLSVSKGGFPFWIPVKYSFKLSEFTEG